MSRILHVLSEDPIPIQRTLQIAGPGDIVRIEGQHFCGSDPVDIPPGVTLIGGPGATLFFDGKLPLSGPQPRCCVNLLPGVEPVSIMDLAIIVNTQPGNLCGPLGHAGGSKRVILPDLRLNNVSIHAASDCLYFKDAQASIVATNCTFASAFDILYVNADVQLVISRSHLHWHPDPLRTGNICSSWGAVLGEASVTILDSLLRIEQRSPAKYRPTGLTCITRGKVTLVRTRIHNPGRLPIVNGLAFQPEGTFSIDDSIEAPTHLTTEAAYA